MKATDIAGQHFGRLTVLEEVGRDATGHKFVRCRCECGKGCVTRKTAVVTGDCQSCGCLQRERSATRSKRRAVPMVMRFWKLVNKNGPMPTRAAKGKCWLWTGASNGRYLADHGRSKMKKQTRDVAWFPYSSRLADKAAFKGMQYGCVHQTQSSKSGLAI